jgi:V/A-type H+-transporting ATPase subunit I
MNRVELVVPERDIVAVTEALAESRAFEVDARGPRRSEAGEGGVSGTNEWDQRAATYTTLLQRITTVMELLAVEAGTPPTEALHWIDPDTVTRDIDTIEREAKGPVEELQNARRKLEALSRTRSQVAPLVGLDADLQRLQNTTYLFAALGSMPADNVDRLQASLEHIPSVVARFGERDRMATVVLFGMKRDAEMLMRAARSAYLTVVELPAEYQGTPRDVLASLDEGITRTSERIAALETTLHRLHEARIRRLRHLLWRVRASLTLVQTIAGFRQFRYSYLLSGWVPEPKVSHVRRTVAAVSPDTTIEASKPTSQERATAPFQFANPQVIRGFQKLVTIYGFPSYEELDPTLLLVATFPVIFGVMFGDVGHGLLLMALGFLLLSRKVRALQNMASFGGVVVACGAAATLFGALFGSLFGFEGVIPVLWLRPIERTTDILLASVVFGVGVLTLGMAFNMVGAALRHRWGEALLDRHGLVGVLFYWSLVGLGAGLLSARIPVPSGALALVAGASAVMIWLSDRLKPMLEGHGFGRSNLGMGLVEGFFELFETVLSLMSNTLSYVRMGAFAVAHGALSLVVFILAEMVDPGKSVGYWLVVALGNLVVIGFEGMIVGIQTLRLEYYEFFSKFFTAGGRSFHPLALVPVEDN